MEDVSRRVEALRDSYEFGSLSESDLAATWRDQFDGWLKAALMVGMPEPNAMVLATVGSDGRPGARTVLLRGIDERGFRFNTSYRSRKARELAENPRATLVFPWYAQQRQILVDGVVERLDAEESDAYFAQRPRASRIAAEASPQSAIVESREWLERRFAEVEDRFTGVEEVPRPEHWGGFIVVPDAVEFWQGRRDRLHDRLRYRRDGDAWVIERLAP